MLSAGFATTTYLRSRLMPDEAAGESEWDAAVAALGKSVAAKFDSHCNRGFARVVDEVNTFEARATAWTLRRYPVESVSLVRTRDTLDAYSAIAAGDWWIDKEAGLLETRSVAGTQYEKLVVTYTGGYWLDPRDGTAMPSGATALPADVLESWVLQCQHDAETRGLFTAVSFRRQADESAPKTIDAGLLEATIQTLRPFRRFAGN
jgi:hypothetical protein